MQLRPSTQANSSREIFSIASDYTTSEDREKPQFNTKNVDAFAHDSRGEMQVQVARCNTVHGFAKPIHSASESSESISQKQVLPLTRNKGSSPIEASASGTSVLSLSSAALPQYKSSECMMSESFPQ